MTGQMVKVKAAHQIVHDGQTLLPGTVFMASEALATELRVADAIEKPDKEEGEPVVLTPQQVRIAADKQRLADAQKKLTDDEDDGLKAK